LDSESVPPRKSYWEGTAEYFDGKRAKAFVIPVAIGPDGFGIGAGEAAGLYRKGEIALAGKSGNGDYLHLALKAPSGAMVAIRDQPQALEWLRAAGLVPRPIWSGTPFWGKALALGGFLAAFCAFMYGYGLEALVDATVRALPNGIDRALGASAAKAFGPKSEEPREAAASRALAKSASLVRTLRPGYGDSVNILIARDSSVKNAFAFPGGTIVVFSGMLRLLETQEEWMALLAHEGGHLHLRHGTRQLVRSGLLGLGIAVLFGDVSGASSVLLDNAGSLADLGYSRRDEAEADAFALETLGKGGYATSGLASLLGKFLRFRELPGWAAFLSTHPATADRLAAMKNARTGTGGLLLTAEEWAALKRL
jgi:hypothetical protein